jgi:hypothetical protein
MSALPDEGDHHQEVRQSLADLVRRSLIQLGDMENLNDRLHLLGERLSKVTPLHQQPAEPENPDESSEERKAS